MLRWTAPVAALVALGAPRAGHADDPRSDARAHYARGLELAGQHGYEGALREFEAAYAISPQFAVLYNIGQAQIALGRTREAIGALTRYLRDGGDRIPSGRRGEVERQIAWLRSSLPNPDLPSEAETERATAAAAGEAIAAASENARLLVSRLGTLAVSCAEPGLKLTLDGKHVDPVASARGLALPAGAHRLVLALPARRPIEQTVAVSDGTATVILCENLVPPLAAAAGPTPALGPPVFSELAAGGAPPTIHARTVAYLLGGLGLALGGAAIGVYVWNRGQAANARSEYAHLDDGGLPAYYDRAVQYNQDVDEVHRNSELTIGLAVTSVGLLAGSVYLWLRERRHGERASAAGGARSWAAVAPGGAVWGGVW